MHRCEIVDIGIIPNTEYLVRPFEINPGNPVLFPWLSKIAMNYECFRFHHLQFTYHPSCPADTKGRIVLAYEPDYHDPEPVNMLETQMIAGATGFAPWTGGSLTVDKHFLSRQGTNALFVSDTPGAETDLSIGRFYIATEGGDEFYPSGFLTVSYDLELSVPQNHDHSHKYYNGIRSETVVTSGGAGGTFDLWRWEGVEGEDTLLASSHSDMENNGFAFTTVDNQLRFLKGAPRKVTIQLLITCHADIDLSNYFILMDDPDIENDPDITTTGIAEDPMYISANAPLTYNKYSGSSLGYNMFSVHTYSFVVGHDGGDLQFKKWNPALPNGTEITLKTQMIITQQPIENTIPTMVSTCSKGSQIDFFSKIIAQSSDRALTSQDRKRPGTPTLTPTSETLDPNEVWETGSSKSWHTPGKHESRSGFP
jgi:hypothetical protein